MNTKINGEQQVQILSPNFSISPSNEDYVLNISANGKDFSPLFAVSAGVTRLVSNVAPGSYYKLVGNRSDVVINWQRMCATEGGGSGTELQPVADFPLNAVEGTVISYTGSSSASGVYQYDGNEWSEVSPDLSIYWTSAETQSAITAVEDHLFDVEQVTASALTELHYDVLELSARTVDLSDYWTSAETKDAIDEAISGVTPSAKSPIIPAIATQAEYETISGDVKTGDLIQVNDVDINGDNETEDGLFEAFVEVDEDEGVGRKRIIWTEKDNGNSVLYSEGDYPWMVHNNVYPIDLGANTFIISQDSTSEDDAFNGIGFDGDGKPVITHFAPQYDETGEVTGITRENANMVTSTSVSTIWRGTQAEYDAIVDKDPNTFYIVF